MVAIIQSKRKSHFTASGKGVIRASSHVRTSSHVRISSHVSSDSVDISPLVSSAPVPLYNDRSPSNLQPSSPRKRKEAKKESLKLPTPAAAPKATPPPTIIEPVTEPEALKPVPPEGKKPEVVAYFRIFDLSHFSQFQRNYLILNAIFFSPESC